MDPRGAHSDAGCSDIVLVGGGIMSATLAAMLKELVPSLSIRVFEVTDEPAREASDGWSNAGTGHAGLCEISYTPGREADGSVRVDRAVAVFEQFEHSKQFWAHAVARGMAGEASGFIHAVPHVCFVRGTDDVAFLAARTAAMRQHHFFRSMAHTADPTAIAAWAPLVMEGREPGPVAATRDETGTEVNFGLLARRLLGWFAGQDGCVLSTGCRVSGLARDGQGWRLMVERAGTGERFTHHGRFVFVGAGGGTLRLLQTTGLAEAAGLACFPIGGEWLVCDEATVADRHDAKVYGAVPPASPSLGAGHLDVRRLDGRRQLLFGPFASWTTRFLRRTGHWSDLPRSLRLGNMTTLLRSAIRNGPLVRYLVDQGLQGMSRRMTALRDFYPLARSADWRLVEAGIRVQTIKKADRGGLSFGTEVWKTQDRSLAALLGASPGASVSVNIALETIRTCLPELLATAEGSMRMKRMIPTYDVDLKLPASAGVFASAAERSAEVLGLASPGRY
jgi:malate dehydrogenase (quinone)